MSSGYKRLLSSLATQGSRPQKVPSPSDCTEQQVAPAEHHPQESSSPVFTFGDVQATSSFTFVSRHPFDEIATPAAVVSSALDVAFPTSPLETDISPFGGGDSPPRAGDAGAHPLDDTPADEEPIADSMTVVAPESPDISTPEFYPIPKSPTLESASADVQMECDREFGSPSEAMFRKSALITDETSDDEGSQLSYVSYPEQDLKIRSIVSLSSDDSRMDGTTPRGRRSPYIGISPREHSLYQARRRGSDGSVVRLLDVVDALQRSSSSNNQTASLSIGQDVQAIDISNEETNPPADPQEEPTGRADAEKIAVDAPGHSVDDATTPAHEPMREDTIPPPVDSTAPPAPRLRRVRVRGVFIIGRGAPIKIDEDIEVHLRDGIGGHVDFII